MHKEPVDARGVRKGALKFFDWAYKNGDKMAEELDYIPMPDGVVELVHDEWKPRSRIRPAIRVRDELGDRAIEAGAGPPLLSSPFRLIQASD